MGQTPDVYLPRYHSTVAVSFILPLHSSAVHHQSYLLMAAFATILGQSSFDHIYSSIDRFQEDSLQTALANFHKSNPNLTLSPTLSYCIDQGKVTPFEALLQAGATPDEGVVEVAALKDDETFLFKLLEHGWPINQTLQRGRIPSLLW